MGQRRPKDSLVNQVPTRLAHAHDGQCCLGELEPLRYFGKAVALGPEPDGPGLEFLPAWLFQEAGCAGHGFFGLRNFSTEFWSGGKTSHP
jgi:hypothetical protein